MNNVCFFVKCSGVVTLTAPTGFIDDYYDTYPADLTCGWIIQPSDENTIDISVTFLTLDTESGIDLVQIYDGDSTSSTLLGTYSGSIPPSPISSTGAVLFVQFTTSSGGTAGEGLRVQYARVSRGISFSFLHFRCISMIGTLFRYYFCVLYLILDIVLLLNIVISLLLFIF